MNDSDQTADFGTSDSTLDPTYRDEEIKIAICGSQAPTIPVLLNLSDIQADGYVVLDSPELWIGRDETCGIVIDDNRISRRHVCLQYHPPVGSARTAEVTLIDNKSKNGTFVNGDDVTGPVLLRNGDRIMVGGTVFGFFHRTPLEVDLEGRHRAMLKNRGYVPAETRVPVDIGVTMSVVFPEDTFSPSKFSAHIRDISRRGARLSTREISREMYSKMMRSKRHVRVVAVGPREETRIQLKGQVVWIHYEENEEGRNCSLGICFDPLDKQCAALVDYLAVRYSPPNDDAPPPGDE